MASALQLLPVLTRSMIRLSALAKEMKYYTRHETVLPAEPRRDTGMYVARKCTVRKT